MFGRWKICVTVNVLCVLVGWDGTASYIIVTFVIRTSFEWKRTGPRPYSLKSITRPNFFNNFCACLKNTKVQKKHTKIFLCSLAAALQLFVSPTGLKQINIAICCHDLSSCLSFIAPLNLKGKPHSSNSLTILLSLHIQLNLAIPQLVWGVNMHCPTSHPTEMDGTHLKWFVLLNYLTWETSDMCGVWQQAKRSPDKTSHNGNTWLLSFGMSPFVESNILFSLKPWRGFSSLLMLSFFLYFFYFFLL